MEKKTEIGYGEFGNIVIRGELKGWSGCRFDRQETVISARRVDPDGVQISVTVTDYFPTGTTRKMRGSFRLTPQQLHQLTEHLAQPWPGIKR